MKQIKNKKTLTVILIFTLIIFLIVGIFVILNNKEKIGSAGISLAEFEEIDIGMSQNTVDSIIDQKDEWDDDEVYEKCCQEISRSEDNHIYKYEYKYLGENGGYAKITFEADYSNGDLFVLPTVSNKENFNLK